MSLQPGSRLGGYEIVGTLGAGGMGEVYRARDLKLGREVAIKVLPEEFARDPERISRFEREARMLAAVNHPTIAAIYGAEEDGPTRYIVMELVEGDTLAERLAGGPLAVGESLRIGAGIAEALEIAHEKGVLHRDLKPANIKLTKEGRVKVLDFGLAKALDLPFSGDISRSPTLGDSRPGDIVGTPEFMSPEQARGKETDRRTDIWAFGCVLYEMLSARRAFTGDSIPAVLLAIVQQEPDWSALPARTPQRVRDLLAVCLEKDPSRRLRDAGDARLEIEAAIAGLSGAGGRAALGSRRGRRLWLAATIALALAGGAYLWRRAREPASPAPGSRQLAVLPFRNLTGSPDGDLWGLGMVETVSARLAGVPGLQVVTPRAAVEAVDQNPSFVVVARRLGANTLLVGTLQRESSRFRITYRLVDAKGNQIAAAAIDGSELFSLQDRVADEVVRDLRLRGSRRTPTPTGLETASQQERYLEAIGRLQRYDQPASIDDAVKILESLSVERPAAPLVQAALGRAYLARFNLTRDSKWVTLASEACKRAGLLQPNLPEVDITLGELYLRTGEYRQAVAAYQRALTAQPSNFEATLGLARAFDATGDSSNAEQTYRRAIRMQPAYFAGYSKFAAFYYTHGRLDEAAAMFRKVTELTPDNARGFANLGAVYLAQGKFDRAVVEFQKSVGLAPNDLAWSNLGTAQYYLGRYADAATSYENSVRLLPDHYENWGNLGDAYRQIPGREAHAAEACEKSVALARTELATNPRDATARSYLALCLAKTGKTTEAETEARRSLEAESAAPEILYNAAIVSNRAGKSAEALDRLRKALQAGYTAEIARREPELANLRGVPAFQEIVQSERRKGS